MRKPLTKTEIKHLVYLHMNRDKMTREEAMKKVAEVIKQLRKTKGSKNKPEKKSFKESFELMSLKNDRKSL